MSQYDYRPHRRPARPTPLVAWLSWRTFFRACILLGIWGLIALVAILGWYGSRLPKIIDSAALSRKPSITILAEDGSMIARYGDITGAIINVEQLPPQLVQAVLAVEDRRFYSHFGIDPLGIARAFYVNFKTGRLVQGGSTITQQLAKNMFLSADRNLDRKVQEALLALWLEWKFTKNEILTAYLNRVYLGAGAFGVDAAARVYYGKSAKELNLKQSAVIAGLLRAPSRYSPAANPELAEQRAQTVLQTMVDAGFLSDIQLKAMREAPQPPRTVHNNNDYGRYFADYVMDKVEEEIGTDHGDLIVQTTLRPTLERAAEKALFDGVTEGASKKVTQGAAVILSPDGAIRALVGGKDYDSSQFNRATQAQRQPGSSFKPIIYYTALEAAGYTPESMVEDTPLQIANYSPDNYGGEYRGWIPMKEALAKSLNTVAVRLLQEAGINKAQAVAQRLDLPTPKTAGLSYALGVAEVTPLQLAAAYASFANGGYKVEPYAITMIRSGNNQVLWRHRALPPEQVLNSVPLAMLVNMMKGVVQFGTGTAAALPDRPMAGKTGTSQDFRDAWFMGFTGDYVGGVWMGNDDNSPMRRITGGSLPAKTWKAMMTVAEAGLPARALATDGITYDTSPDPRNAPAVETGDVDPLVEAGLMTNDDAEADTPAQPQHFLAPPKDFNRMLEDLSREP